MFEIIHIVDNIIFENTNTQNTSARLLTMEAAKRIQVSKILVLIHLYKEVYFFLPLNWRRSQLICFDAAALLASP